ncbi:unnamed protein product [Clonostachys rhizophaga]|uniref:HNH nuclease domain-containing protein n=1 Tax=Clonostachys rhizophaga TaxID=160324 RepID=A0A9N9VGU3_9HYPO|nr:unnamed protein product [Clonostachys rhizophaga]
MPRLPDDQIQEAQGAFDAFVTRETGHPSDHAALLRFLQQQVPMSTNIKEVRDPIPDQIKRIQLIYDTKENLQKSFGDDFIGILLFGDDLIQGNDYTISERLTLLEPFLARFLQKSTVIPSNLNLSTSPHEPGAKEVNRNKSESNKALERDGKRCLVTGAIKPDVCHIIAFRLNSNPVTEPQSRHIFARILVHILPAQDGKNLMRLLFPTHQGKQVPGAWDKIWNLLTLSPQVHRYRSSCYFAFKWVGVLNPDLNAKTQTVQLEFRWMPRSIATALGDEGLGKARPQHPRKGDAFRPVNTDTMTPERMSEIIRDCMDSSSLTSTVQPKYQQPTGEYPTLVDHESFLPIKSGYIINVKEVINEDIPKMKLAIDLQYVAIRLGGMSGAADAIDSLDPQLPPRYMIRYNSEIDSVSYELYTPFPKLRVLGDEEGEEGGVDLIQAGGEPDQKKQG